ncbi:MAG: hypothetical protein OEZ68_02410 [Gammaproteobacteria bacterium]|nr:hypothetical protein [Gammaproteobacteria bacterium]MDH5799635.1 hypothetical protein [Gammaproteobacteria bacterium]
MSIETARKFESQFRDAISPLKAMCYWVSHVDPDNQEAQSVANAMLAHIDKAEEAFCEIQGLVSECAEIKK